MSESKKGALLKHAVSYSFASYVAQGVGIVNSIALRNFMGPLTMGIWSVLQVLLSYASYASFGTTKAMAREYPHLRGKNEHAKAEDLKDMILTFCMAMSLIPAVIFIIYAVMKWSSVEPAYRIGLIFLIFFLFLQRFYDFIITLLRSDKKFETLSRVIILNAVGGLAGTLLLVSWGKLYGLFAGTVLVMTCCIGYIQKMDPYRFKVRWDLRGILSELRLGIPLLTVGFLVQFLKGLDKLLVAQHLGFYEVGLYSIAMMVSNYVHSLPMMFAHVLAPSTQEAFAKKESASAIRDYLLKPVFGFSVLTPFLCGLAIFLTPLVVRLFLPRFESGIPAMKIYLTGSYFLMLMQFGSNFLITLNRIFWIIPVSLISIGLNYGLNLFFLKLGWGFTGVALGSAISFACYGLGIFILALGHFASIREILGYLGKLFLILVSYFGIIFGLDYFVQCGNFYVSVAVKTGLFLILSTPFFWYLEKETGFRKVLQEVISKKFVKKEKAPLEDEEEVQLPS